MSDNDSQNLEPDDETVHVQQNYSHVLKAGRLGRIRMDAVNQLPEAFKGVLGDEVLEALAEQAERLGYVAPADVVAQAIIDHARSEEFRLQLHDAVKRKLDHEAGGSSPRSNLER